jgi:hypothetical protein
MGALAIARLAFDEEGKAGACPERQQRRLMGLAALFRTSIGEAYSTFR